MTECVGGEVPGGHRGSGTKVRAASFALPSYEPNLRICSVSDQMYISGMSRHGPRPARRGAARRSFSQL